MISVRGFLARELAEVFLDVLDFECAGFERVLFDQILHQCGIQTSIMVHPRLGRSQRSASSTPTPFRAA